MLLIFFSFFKGILIDDFKLKKIEIYCAQNLKTNIYSSFNQMQNTKLFILIPDLMQAPGILDNSTMLINGIEEGTASKMLYMAIKENFSIVILNPNKKQYKGKEIKMDYYSHIEFTFKEHIEKYSNFISELIIYTSGFGANSIIKLLDNDIYNQKLMKATKKIVIGEGKCLELAELLSNEKQDFWIKKVVNYIPNEEPLGKFISSHKDSKIGCVTRSAGVELPNKVHLYLEKEILHYMKDVY